MTRNVACKAVYRWPHRGLDRHGLVLRAIRANHQKERTNENLKRMAVGSPWAPTLENRKSVEDGGGGQRNYITN